MNIVNLKQGSAEWLEWRRSHIGASDVPVIMGTSEFMKPHELWLLKTGRKEPFKGNFATERGQRAEPHIRALYRELYLNGAEVESPVAEYSAWPVMSASFDAMNSELGVIAEFKYPSAVKHDQAKQGIVPDGYFDQIQAQLMISGYDTCHYVSFNGSAIAVVTVRADKERQREIEERCRMFWACVESDSWVFPDAPKEVYDSPNLEVMSKRYLELIRLQRQVEDEMKMIKKRISDVVTEKKASFYGLRLVRSERAGSVDYSQIPQLEGVDLEQYRKPATEVVTIKEDQ